MTRIIKQFEATPMIDAVIAFQLTIKGSGPTGSNGELADPRTKITYHVSLKRFSKSAKMYFIESTPVQDGKPPYYVTHGIYDPHLKVIRSRSGWPIEAGNINEVIKQLDKQVAEFLK